MAVDQKLQQAYQLIKQGKKTEATAILVPIVRENNDNADAWWLLANAVNNTDQSKRALQQVLRIRPDDARAQRMLDKLTGKLPMTGPLGTGPLRDPSERTAPPPPAPAPPPRQELSDEDLFALPRAPRRPVDEPVITPSERRRAALDAPFEDDPFAAPPRREETTPPPAKSARKPAPRRRSDDDDDLFNIVPDFDGDPFAEGKPRRRPERVERVVEDEDSEPRRNPALIILGILLVLIIVAGIVLIIITQNRGGEQPTAADLNLTATGMVSNLTAIVDTASAANPQLATQLAGEIALTAAAANPQLATAMAQGTLMPDLENLPDMALTAAANPQLATAMAQGTPAPEMLTTLTGGEGAPNVGAMLENATAIVGTATAIAQGTVIPELESVAATATAVIQTATAQGNVVESPVIVRTPAAVLTAAANLTGTPAPIVELLPQSADTPAPDVTLIASGDGSALPDEVLDRGTLAFGVPVTDTLEDLTDHRWTFEGEADTSLVIELTARDNTFDPQLYLFDPNDVQIAENEDIDLASRNRNSRIEIVLPETGTYSILVSGFGFTGGDYELSLTLD